MIKNVACPIALATALWFALLGRKAGRSWGWWAAWGAVFGFVVSDAFLAISVLAFGPAPGIPRNGFRLDAAILAVLGVILLGRLATTPLRRHDGRGG